MQNLFDNYAHLSFIRNFVDFSYIPLTLSFYSVKKCCANRLQTLNRSTDIKQSFKTDSAKNLFLCCANAAYKVLIIFFLKCVNKDIRKTHLLVLITKCDK